MKKTIAITILSTTIILFTALAIIGMNMEDENTNAVVDTASRDTFISSCMNENAGYAYCACGYDYLVDQYGFKGMIKIFEKMSDTDELPQEILETYNQCKNR